MTKVLSPEEAVARAQRAQEGRIDAIRTLAEARQNSADVANEVARKLAEVKATTDAQLTEAERTDLRAYNAAIAAGWSVDDLRKVGFDEPEKKKRIARRSRAPKVSTATPDVQPAPSDEQRQDALV
ncbi:hypothetical protein [Leifsonia shinshuensis]